MGSLLRLALTSHKLVRLITLSRFKFDHQYQPSADLLTDSIPSFEEACCQKQGCCIWDSFCWFFRLLERMCEHQMKGFCNVLNLKHHFKIFQNSFSQSRPVFQCFIDSALCYFHFPRDTGQHMTIRSDPLRQLALAGRRWTKEGPRNDQEQTTHEGLCSKNLMFSGIKKKPKTIKNLTKEVDALRFSRFLGFNLIQSKFVS